MKVSEIGDRMDGVYVEGVIVRKSGTSTMNTGFGPVLYAQAILRDETGEIKLSLWRDQTKLNVGGWVRIENGFTKFKEMNAGSRGRMTIL